MGQGGNPGRTPICKAFDRKQRAQRAAPPEHAKLKSGVGLQIGDMKDVWHFPQTAESERS